MALKSQENSNTTNFMEMESERNRLPIVVNNRFYAKSMQKYKQKMPKATEKRSHQMVHTTQTYIIKTKNINKPKINRKIMLILICARARARCQHFEYCTNNNNKLKYLNIWITVKCDANFRQIVQPVHYGLYAIWSVICFKTRYYMYCSPFSKRQSRFTKSQKKNNNS